MENKHEKKKTTKTIKVQDLKPKKDAKGGVSVRSPNVIAKLVKTRRGNLRLKSSTLVQSLGAVFIYPFCNLLNRQPNKTKRAAVLPLSSRAPLLRRATPKSISLGSCALVRSRGAVFYVHTLLPTVFTGIPKFDRDNRLPLFEVALVLVRFDHVASIIVNADHSGM